MRLGQNKPYKEDQSVYEQVVVLRGRDADMPEECANPDNEDECNDEAEQSCADATQDDLEVTDVIGSYEQRQWCAGTTIFTRDVQRTRRAVLPTKLYGALAVTIAYTLPRLTPQV